MRVRIRYSKQGRMKYIGHLDMMRFFQKACRRAGIDVAYTEGMSPHMSMSFALPLGVGMTSDSEYVDVDLSEPLTEKELLERLNRSRPDGIRFTAARQIGIGKAHKGMSLTARADYSLTFREGYSWDEGWTEAFEKWLEQDEIPVVKKGKRTEKVINIRPLIFGVKPGPCGSESGPDIRLALSAGQESNLRPELVMQAFAEGTGREWSPFIFLINRDELYADVGKGGEHDFVPLIDLGTELTEERIRTPDQENGSC